MKSNSTAKLIIILSSVGVVIGIAAIVAILVIAKPGNSDKSSSKKVEDEEKPDKKKKDKPAKSEEITVPEDEVEEEPPVEIEPEYNPTTREHFVDNRDPLEILAGDYYLASGAGGWETSLEINEDGTFTADFHDSDMGDMAEEYPDGTLYLGSCTGRFEVVGSVDEYTYRLKVVDKKELYTPDVIEIVDGIRQIYTETYGVEGDGEFEMYLPGKNVSEMTEDSFMWIGMTSSDVFKTTFLTIYAVRNVSTDALFIGERPDVKFEFPENEVLTDISELSGTYDGDDGTVMTVDINRKGYDYSDEKGRGCGLIHYEEDSLPANVDRRDAVLKQFDGAHFEALPFSISEYDQKAYYGWQTYKLHVSRNSDGKLVLTIYDEKEFVYAVFTQR